MITSTRSLTIRRPEMAMRTASSTRAPPSSCVGVTLKAETPPTMGKPGIAFVTATSSWRRALHYSARCSNRDSCGVSGTTTTTTAAATVALLGLQPHRPDRHLVALHGVLHPNPDGVVPVLRNKERAMHKECLSLNKSGGNK